VPLSTAQFPSVVLNRHRRRLDALCRDAFVGISSGSGQSVRMPTITAETDEVEFRVETSNFSLECSSAAASWIGSPKEMSVWVVDGSEQVHSCVCPEEVVSRSEALERMDRVVAVSKSLSSGLERFETVLEMALCDDPSLTTAASWLFDAADQANLDGPHIVLMWRVS